MTDSIEIPSINEIKEKLSPLFKEERLQLTLLFGSVVSGRIHSKSDIDLAFLFDGPADILTSKIVSGVNRSGIPDTLLLDILAFEDPRDPIIGVGPY